MKRALVACVSFLLALAPSAAAQAINASISSIPPRPAFDPGRVTIQGSFLGIITDVSIDGVGYPILRNTGDRIVVGPVPPQDPGFSHVVLSNTGGSLAGTLELTPTLLASRKGQKVTAVMNNGGAGTYLLAGSFRRLPVLVADAGIYYGRLISINSPVLAAGVFTDATPVEVVAKIPIEIGLIGAPFNLQARCSLTDAGVTSYSNLASVPGLGQHQ